MLWILIVPQKIKAALCSKYSDLLAALSEV